jgi:hypothetical protein
MARRSSALDLAAELVAEVVDDGGQEAAGAASRVHHHFALVETRIDTVGHEGGDGARRVELARIARTAQIVEQLLVHVAQAGTGLEVMEVDGIFQLLDHGQHLRAGFHVVVGVFKDLLDDFVRGAPVGVDLILERREELVVDEDDQLAAGNLRFLLALVVGLVGGPVTPAVALRQGGPISGAVVFPLFFALVEDLEKEHPGELAQTLGVTVDAVVLAHDVLDGLDGAAEIHRVLLLS